MLINQKGFTLYELMVAIGIGGFSVMIAIGTMVSVTHQNTEFTRAMDNDIEESRAIAVMNSYMSQATQLLYAGNTDLNSYAPTTNGNGQIRDYDSNFFFGTLPDTQTLAVFWRDAAHSRSTASAGLASNLTPTAIYFQKPTATTYGVLYISQGAPLTPTRSSVTFDGLERVRITNIFTYRQDTSVSPIQAPVTSFELELTFRRFFNVGESVPAHSYCPDGLISASCPKGAPHKDVIRNYRVDIRDNVLMTSLTGVRGARLYDQVHFFAPLLPGGL